MSFGIFTKTFWVSRLQKAIYLKFFTQQWTTSLEILRKVIFWKETRPLWLLGGKKEMTKIHMLHYSNRENNPGHHGHCLYGSESASICSFCFPRGLVHFVHTNGITGFPLALVTKQLKRCLSKQLHLDQKPESIPGDVFWLFLPVFLFAFIGRCTLYISKQNFASSIGPVVAVPCPNQQHLQRKFCNIWELENICELHCSKRCYKNVM